MESQAYAPTWNDGPCLPRLQPGRDFFASSSLVFSVRIDVLSKVNCNHNPKHVYKCLELASVKLLVIVIRRSADDEKDGDK